jgi:hypothetical protein
MKARIIKNKAAVIVGFIYILVIGGLLYLLG